MAEVLSQSQIDSILNAALNGGVNVETSAEVSAGKKYRMYNFYSPRKFTKDRIRMLNSVFDHYTRLINTRLNSLLHTSCEIEVESVEEQRYYEFSNALTEGDVLALAYMEMKDKTDENPVLFYISTSVALSIMDRLMGGEGNADDDIPLEYTFTTLELQLYEYIMRDLVSYMGGSWENYLKLEFNYGRTEVNPTLVQLIGLDETVVLVDMKMKFSNCSGRMSVCFPGMMLTNIFAEINRDNPVTRFSGEKKSEAIFDSLRETTLPIVAELESTELTLSDIYSLRVGDVINLNQPKNAPAYLKVGGKVWFSGQMGVLNKNMVVKVADVYNRKEKGTE